MKPQVSDVFVARWICLLLSQLCWGKVIRRSWIARIRWKLFWERARRGREELVIEGMFNYAYRQGDWALIPPYYNPYSKEEGDFIGLGYGYKLYNLKKDIGQRENVAAKYPKKLGELINRFEYLKSTTNKVTRY